MDKQLFLIIIIVILIIIYVLHNTSNKISVSTPVKEGFDYDPLENCAYRDHYLNLKKILLAQGRTHSVDGLLGYWCWRGRFSPTDPDLPYLHELTRGRHARDIENI